MANLKDSGDRREFGTGAVRDMADGKGRMDLIPWDVALHIREFMHNLCIKYGKNMRLDDVIDRFSSIEWCLNGCRSYLKENFEMAAACWIMHHYFYAVQSGSLDFEVTINEDDEIGFGTIDKIWATATMDVAKHFEDGAKKYSDNNWRKGIPVWCYFDSASRHFMKYILGWTDEPHDRAILWNLMCGAWTACDTVTLEGESSTEGL